MIQSGSLIQINQWSIFAIFSHIHSSNQTILILIIKENQKIKISSPPLNRHVARRNWENGFYFILFAINMRTRVYSDKMEMIFLDKQCKNMSQKDPPSHTKPEVFYEKKILLSHHPLHFIFHLLYPSYTLTWPNTTSSFDLSYEPYATLIKVMINHHYLRLHIRP